MNTIEQMDLIFDHIQDILTKNVNVNVKELFESSYTLFESIVKNEVKEEEIQKMVSYYVSQLYEIVYTKASYQEELLNDYINDEDGHFFEYYQKYTPSKNQEVVTHLNEIIEDINSMNFNQDNFDYVKNYIQKFIYLYNMCE
jgi:hypothetical protein